jgi:nicotinamidase-related amidase
VFDIVVDNSAFRGLLPRILFCIADVCIAGVTDLSSLDSIANDAAKLGIRTWVVKDATEVVPASTLSASSYQAFKVTDSVEIANMLKA